MHAARLIGVFLALQAVVFAAGGPFVADLALDSPTPKGNGLDLDRSINPRSVELTHKGQKSTGWVSEARIDPKQSWMNVMRFKVSDQRFWNGKTPAIDVTAEVHMPGWGNITFVLDTPDGPKVVGSSWGHTSTWKTVNLRIDTSRMRQGEKDGVLGPFDLAILGANGPIHVRSLKLTGYETRKNVVWSRMLKFTDIKTGRDGGVLAFPQGKAKFTVDVANIAFVDVAATYAFEIMNSAGSVVHRVAGELPLKAKADNPLELSFDSGKWKLGPYLA